jgi:IS30 family transposase
MSYQHLTYEERHTISTLRRNGSKPSHIAQQLGRHVSTINRELRRNATLEGGYQYRYAHSKARQRSLQADCRTERCSAESWAFVVTQLCAEQWSPEQIRDELPKHHLPSISHETIYAPWIQSGSAQVGLSLSVEVPGSVDGVRHVEVNMVLRLLATGEFVDDVGEVQAEPLLDFA